MLVLTLKAKPELIYGQSIGGLYRLIRSCLDTPRKIPVFHPESIMSHTERSSKDWSSSRAPGQPVWWYLHCVYQWLKFLISNHYEIGC